MARPPAPPCLPPTDLHTHALDVLPLAGPLRAYRIHWPGCLEPQHMAPPGADNGFRFDDAARAFRVMYLADALETCVLETLIRNEHPDRLGRFCIAEQRLRGSRETTDVRGRRRTVVSERQLSIVEIDSAARLAQLSGAQLTRFGIANLCTWDDYGPSQAWSRALYDHPTGFDGLAFRSRFDNEHRSYGLYERAYTTPGRVKVVETVDLCGYGPFLDLLDRWEVVVV